MKKVLITGCTGMLGADIAHSLQASDQYEVYGAGRTTSHLLPRERQFQFDLSEPDVPLDLSFEPDVIIHTAAITDLGLCERNPQLAEAVHVRGSRALAKMAGKKTLFIYISTDSVFDGKSGQYSESDVPNPMNVYARTKFEGEQSVVQENRGITSVIRTNIYGLHTPMKNSLAEWAYKEWSHGRTTTGFTDTIFNAVYTRQLAEVIRHIIEKNIIHPVLNIGSSEAISKYEFLRRFGHFLKVDPAAAIKEGLSDTFPSAIVRPKNTSLNTALLSTFYEVPSFEDGLRNLAGHISKYAAEEK